jgi:predicted nucleic acid-binding protein
MQKPLLVAVDTNFPFLLADGDDGALDALEIVRTRVRPARIFLPPTALEELIDKSENDTNEEIRRLAQKALAGLHSNWSICLIGLDSIQERLVEEAARRTREAGIVPYEELNDAIIVAESAVLNSILLVSNDSHLLQLDHRRLGLLFRELDLPVPLIVSPREIVRKFYR